MRAGAVVDTRRRSGDVDKEGSSGIWSVGRGRGGVPAREVMEKGVTPVREIVVRILIGNGSPDTFMDLSKIAFPSIPLIRRRSGVLAAAWGRPKNSMLSWFSLHLEDRLSWPVPISSLIWVNVRKLDLVSLVDA
ncbi:hypothetical protein RUND412_010250 [Rhizina undulata]